MTPNLDNDLTPPEREDDLILSHMRKIAEVEPTYDAAKDVSSGKPCQEQVQTNPDGV
jgi:hypothetical protein